MEFRPCIDIHNGKVKQIVGGSVKDEGDCARENFVSEKNASWYAKLFLEKGLKNGHVILLNSQNSAYYEATRRQAISALEAYPGGLQIGGGINADNAAFYLQAGASHVIVTSYVFKNGEICWENLEKLAQTVGKEHIVLDLSCRKKDGAYYIVTDRWQKYTNVLLSFDVFDSLAAYCDEFLIHAVDVEGKQNGIDEELIAFLGSWNKIPVTYAGGIRSMEDIEKIRKAGEGKIHFTVGSALDLYGGTMSFDEICAAVKGEKDEENSKDQS